MNKKTLGLMLVFVLSFALIISAVHADSEDKISFSGDFDKIISSDQIASFDIVLTNIDAPNVLNVTIDGMDGWKLGIGETEFDIIRGEEAALSFNLTPPENVEARTFTFSINVLHNNETITSKQIKISVAHITVPLSVELNLPSEAKPAQEFSIKATFKNKDVKKYKDVKLEFDSEIFEQPFIVKKDFDELGVKEVVKTFIIEPYVAAGDYIFTVYSTIDQQRAKLFEASISVPAVGSLAVDKSSQESFLKTTGKITITNKGNIKIADSYKLPVSSFTRFFKSYAPDPDRVVTEASGVFYLYDVSLEPKQSITVIETFSVLPFIIATILIALLLIWFYRKNKVSVRKEIVPGEAHGDKKTIRIRLIVKNKTHRRIKSVTITDFVPAPLKLIHAQYGTLRPDIVKKQQVATTLVWKLESLAPREERVLTYNALASLKIIGKVSLPPAVVGVKINKKKEIYSSNTVALRWA